MSALIHVGLFLGVFVAGYVTALVRASTRRRELARFGALEERYLDVDRR